MLSPDKHINPKFSVINISYHILKCLKEHDILQYDELLNLLINDISVKIKNVFQYSLSFLFVVGKIEYLQDLDAFRIIYEDNKNIQ